MKTLYKFVILLIIKITFSVAQPSVIGTLPVQNSNQASPSVSIRLTFNEQLDQSTLVADSTLHVRGSLSGIHNGVVSYTIDTYTAIYDPTENFIPGELVTVVATAGIKNIGMMPMEHPFSVNFTIATSPADTFAGRVVYEVNERPTDLTAADLDGDGDIDIVSVLNNSNAIVVLKNNGTGTLSENTEYSTGAGPSSVIAADADRDGDIDIAVANIGSNSISVFRNNGNGTFAARTDLSIGVAPISLACADIDGDGNIDLVSANFFYNSVSVIKNNGDGTFAAPVNYGTGVFTYSTALTDLDNDGDIDIVAANRSDNTVSVLKNNGSGVFGTKADYGTGVQPNTVVCADVDGDGDMDLAVANTGANTVSILKNAGDGTFGTTVDYGTGSEPVDIIADDVDGDGDMDVINANNNSVVISMLRNNGNGEYSERTDYTTGHVPRALISADLDGDGDGDIAVANYSEYTLAVLMNHGPPSIVSVSPSRNALNGSDSATIQLTMREPIDASSLSNDSSVIVHASQSGRHFGTITYHTQSKTISFQSAEKFLSGETVTITVPKRIRNGMNTALPQSYVWTFTVRSNPENELRPITAGTFVTPAASVPFPVGGGHESAAGDLDGDGDCDIVVSFNNYLFKKLNNGNGTFAPQEVLGWAGFSLVTGDLDGDGDLDVASIGSGLFVYLNDGTSALSYAGFYGGPSESSEFAHSPADMDGDGDIDLIIVNDFNHTFSVFKNNGNGTFAPGVDYATGTYPGSIAIADVDHDGDVDAVSSNYSGNSFSVFRNNGDGSFASKEDYATGSHPSTVNVADFDGDGDADIVITNPDEALSSVSIFRNDGEGYFSGRTDYVVSGSPATAECADIDGDGDIDIATVNENANTITVLKNSGDGTFAVQAEYETPTLHRSILCADVDSDGDGDFITVSRFSNEICIFINSPPPGLPVELTSFSVVSRYGHAEVQWHTATETNCYGFEIVRQHILPVKTTNNQEQWVTIGFVTGNGTTNVPHEYAYTDMDLSGGKYLYRLKQIDRDGSFHYSPEREVMIDRAPVQFGLSQNYPNPFNPSTTMGFSVKVSGIVSLKIFDGIGREVTTLVDGFIEAGTYHHVTFDAAQYASGLYFARLQSGSSVQIRCMMLLK